MIGKAKWFKMRKYGGWGIGPTTKEGWIYIGVMMIPFLVVSAIPIEEKTKTIIILGWMAIFLIDVLEIMIKIKKNERDRPEANKKRLHEAIAERNAGWFMVVVIIVGFLYRSIEAGLKEEVYIDPVLATALLGGAMVKSISFWKLREK